MLTLTRSAEPLAGNWSTDSLIDKFTAKSAALIMIVNTTFNQVNTKLTKTSQEMHI
jgi:hypothetical protein